MKIYAQLIFLNKLIEIFEIENDYSQEVIIQKLNDIDENHNYKGQSLFLFLETYLLICVCSSI